MSRQSSTGSWIVAVIVVVVVVVAGVFLARKASHDNGPIAALSPAASTSAGEAAQAAIVRHPIAQAESAPASAGSSPLPSLDGSDASVTTALVALTGDSALRSLLVPTQIIAHAVATIDALPRRMVGRRVLPLHGPKGAFLVTSADGKTFISTKNAARYAPYIHALEAADTTQLTDWYVSHYPLFQQAYEQLGYPKGYFNDRLIAVIDNLLATPDPSQPPALVQPTVLYTYADPSLESLSAGQKMLLRVGPANEAKIKAKLRAIRARLVGQKLPAMPVPAASAGG